MNEHEGEKLIAWREMIHKLCVDERAYINIDMWWALAFRELYAEGKRHPEALYDTVLMPATWKLKGKDLMEVGYHLAVSRTIPEHPPEEYSVCLAVNAKKQIVGIVTDDIESWQELLPDQL